MNRRRLLPFCLFSILLAVPGLGQDDAATIVRYRTAAEHGGNPVRGKTVFESEQSKCATCHLVGPGDRRAGPPLGTIGDKFTRPQLITSILEPSDLIHPDFGRTMLQTHDGQVIAGVLVKRDSNGVELFDTNGKLQRVSIDRIAEEKKGGPSVMPQGLHASMTTDQFVDLIAYLESLKQSRDTASQFADLVDEIPHIARPVTLKPLHDERLRFDFPVCVLPVPGTSNQYVVVEQKSRKVWRLTKSDDGDRKELFVDVANESIGGEFEGLVCLAFHPDYINNGRYFLNYHVREGGIFSPVIVERLAAPDRLSDSGQPSKRLMRILKETDLHWGGMITFGPDGYLYIGAGDGGPQEDPDGNGQNLKRWLGSILRIDVDRQANNLPYAIPANNPYVGLPDALPEIWASGFRMPWRFSFDATGDLWVGDIGQNLFEEVTVARVGEDHGWNVYEGFAEFSERFRRPGIQYTPPIISYRRKLGVSVTGGYVYAGRQNPEFSNLYIFGDFESKRIWALAHRDRKLQKVRQIGECPERIASFGLDRDGELLVVGYAGTIYRMNLASARFE